MLQAVKGLYISIEYVCRGPFESNWTQRNTECIKRNYFCNVTWFDGFSVE